MKLKDVILKGLRKLYIVVRGIKYEPENYVLDRQCANDLIYNLLISPHPCMISRFGAIEIGVVNNYLAVHSNKCFISKCCDYISKSRGLPWWDEAWFKSMRNNMGVFPESFSVLERFSEIYLRDAREIDLLGSMNYTEKYMPLSDDIKKVHIESLYPFFVDKPWTRALKGKKVLVIHPFDETIKKQFCKRNYLFENTDVWPEYELITYHAIQSNAGAEVPYNTWFDALEKMLRDIEKLDFDMAIIGCGAYGLPIAAHIKRMGRKAIHLGGGSQLLFGIKGKRWEEDYFYSYLPKDYTNYKVLFNDYWCRPNENETPSQAIKVEGACYW